MEIQHKVDYVLQGLGRLLEQFKGKPRFVAILTSYLEAIQEVEDALWDIKVSRLIQLIIANGSNDDDLLNKIGDLVGQKREGFSNAIYIILITARIPTNRSDGKRETLITIASLLAPGAPISILEYPRAIEIDAYAPTVVPAPVVAKEFLFAAVEATTRVVFGWLPQPLDETIVFGYSGGGAGVVTPTVAQSLGYSGGGAATGGNWAGAISSTGA